MTRERHEGLRQAEPQTQQERDIEAEVGRIVRRALKEFLRELEQIPSIALEAPEQANGTEERVREITARLFKRG